MYAFENDPVRSLAVWCFDKATNADWDTHFAHLRDLATWSGKTGLRPAALLIPGGFDVPDTEHRTELTQLTALPGYDPFVAFVAPNKAVKTVLQLFALFQRNPKYEMRYVASVAEGIAWLEGKRGAALPELGEMVGRVGARMPQMKLQG